MLCENLLLIRVLRRIFFAKGRCTVIGGRLILLEALRCRVCLTLSFLGGWLHGRGFSIYGSLSQKLQEVSIFCILSEYQFHGPRAY